jgi:hypothetical protein
MICSTCVTPQVLKDFVRRHGAQTTCNYCKKTGIAVDSKFLFDHIYERIRENVAAEDDLSSYERDLIFEMESDDISVAGCDIVLMEWFNLGDEVYFDDLWDAAPDEFKINSEGGEALFYTDDGLLERNFYEDRWAAFLDGIGHAHRFFNPNARAFLDSVFEPLASDASQLKPEVSRTLDRGTKLFRARGADNQKKAEEIAGDPASQFGPSPKDRAGNQRMTPSGISALYCALDRETCLSEIRAITGDDVVSVALTPLASLKLLDLTALALVEPPKMTLLDVGYLDERHLTTFLKSLVRKMSKPKGRNNDLSYLSTQVVFEYLRLRFGQQVDGLVFPSVQTGERGTNVVLFPEASVISRDFFDEAQNWGSAPLAEPECPFGGPAARLAVVQGSLRFHKVKAVVTKAVAYQYIHELYMSDEVRKRMGPIKFEVDATTDDLPMRQD